MFLSYEQDTRFVASDLALDKVEREISEFAGQDRIAQWASENGFEPAEELPRGHCCRVWADLERVLRVPEFGEELESGYHAAWALADSLGPKIDAGDPETGAILMERIRPGFKRAETEGGDDEVWGTISQIVRRLPDGAERLLPLQDFFQTNHPLLQELVQTSPAPRFLHGDLHPENLIWCERRGDWVVIDPKGLWGDPHFEPVAFLRNPLGQLGQGPQLMARIQTRLQRIGADTGLDPGRIAAWGYLDQVAECDEGSPLAQVYRQLMSLRGAGTF